MYCEGGQAEVGSTAVSTRLSGIFGISTGQMRLGLQACPGVIRGK